MDRREEQNRIAELESQIVELKKANAKLKATVEEFRNKEQTISSAIIASMEHANQLEASRKKLYSLDIQRSRLMYLRMEQIINELYVRYPELKKDTKLKDMSEKFKSMVYNDLSEKNKDVPLNVAKKPIEADPIKKLLHNIIDAFDSKKPEEEKPTFKEDFKSTYSENISAQPAATGVFDFNEALNPTMGLDEIMKAFNLNNKKEGTN